MATNTEPVTDDQRTVLIAARDHPSDNPSPREVAESIPDPHIKTSYVERIMTDFSLPDESEGAGAGESEDEDEDNDTGDQKTISAESDVEVEQVPEDLEAAYEGLLTAPARQRQLLAILYCAPEPLPKADIHAILGSSDTYIYQASKVRGPRLIYQVVAEDDANLWGISERGEYVIRRLAKEHPDGLKTELEPIVAITDDWEWNPDWRADLGLEEENSSSDGTDTEGEDPVPDEPSETSALAENREIRSEIEKISQEKGADAFVCTLCEDDPKTSQKFQNVRMHATRSKTGRHRGRHGSEPGVVEINHDLMDVRIPSDNGHDGSVSTEMDLEEIFDELSSGRVSGAPTEDENEGADDTEEYAVTESDDLGRPVIDGTSGSFQGVHERPAITQQNGSEAVESDDVSAAVNDGYSGPAEAHSMPEPQGESTEDAFVEVGMDRETAFDVITSDAPEEFRRQVFDAVADRGE